MVGGQDDIPWIALWQKNKDIPWIALWQKKKDKTKQQKQMMTDISHADLCLKVQSVLLKTH